MEEKMTKEEAVKEAFKKAKEEAGEAAAEAAESTEEEASEETVEETETTEETECDSEEASSENKEEKGKLFGRKKEKKDKNAERVEELTDKLTRQMAEFDNFRKRTEREKSQMYEIGARDVISKILPVVDSFERGLGSHTEEELAADPFMDGMNKVYKQMMTMLNDLGVKPIEAVGAEFNPDFHNAVMHEENEEFGENIISQEFQKGYTYRDSVVRHSMVKVAN